MHVGTGTRALELGEVQAQGKKPMAAADWARGVAFDAEPKLGARLSEPSEQSRQRARSADGVVRIGPDGLPLTRCGP